MIVWRYLCPSGTRYDPRVHNCNHNFLAPPCSLSPKDPVNSPDDNEVPENNSEYVVSATSIYPCSKPGYFTEESSCNNFYVCKEVRPGVLESLRIFR